MQAFLDKYLPLNPGDIVDTTGKILGQHNGIHHYTIGQRKGLGIAAPEPFYVIELDPINNKVIVDHSKATQKESTVNSVNWVSIPQPSIPIKAEVQTRYRSTPTSATIIPLENTRVKIVFDQPQQNITPGQAAVWYQDEKLLGGGIIEPKP
jgi:tRNA-specific 2-thiouridylase